VIVEKTLGVFDGFSGMGNNSLDPFRALANSKTHKLGN
jgi:hypothetical protein